MKIDVFADADAAAQAAAKLIAASARAAVSERGKFIFAVSGGRTPGQMLGDLVREDVPWQRVHMFQVDERIAPAGDRDRNLTQLKESLLSHVSLPPDQVYAMPVESSDLESAATQYASILQKSAGNPPVFDLVHLGLGPDGHTASLIPGDPVLGIGDADVALTGVYQGRRRMTLTYPAIDRARKIVFLVTGSDKCEALVRLRNTDRSIPAGRVQQTNAVVLADRAAAAGLL